MPCMFFPWSLLSFWNITYAKKHIFPRAFSGDLLLNEKQKKPFVSLSDEVTIIASFSYYCFVSASRWGAEHARFEFVLPRRRFDTRSLNFFFCSVPLVLWKIKEIAYRAGEIFLYRLLLTETHNMWVSIERQSREKWCITALSNNILSIVFKYLVACLVVERHHKALINP